MSVVEGGGPLDELLGAWRELAEANARRVRAAALAHDVASVRRGAEAGFASQMARLDLLERQWRRQIAQEIESRLERRMAT